MDENVIYIIIAIIWIVSSILKAVSKNNKKKPPVTTPRTNTPKPATELDDFKKILEEMITGKNPDIVKPQPVNTPTYTENPSAQNNHTEESKYAAYEGTMAYDFTKNQSLEEYYSNDQNRISYVEVEAYKSPETEHISTEKNPVFDDGFDLQKGILYAEILKRPHY
ncbi:MAG: hypothetical protein BWY70_00887 [Bacteroidetes bacterium ADurb.Bin408]|nr:MAG: hypothetical protein BWY70_00887 [Bacteroidetes bacterium ADurb.Bin408]